MSTCLLLSQKVAQCFLLLGLAIGVSTFYGCKIPSITSEGTTSSGTTSVATTSTASGGTITTTTGSDLLTGEWVGSWTSDWGAVGSLATNWTQTGNNFSGSVTIGGSTCFDAETTAGSIFGTSINLSAVSGAIAFLGTVSGSTITGSYVTYRTACLGDTGVFTVSRVDAK